MGMVQTSTGQGYPLLLNNSGSLNPPPVCLDEKGGRILDYRPSCPAQFESDVRWPPFPPLLPQRHACANDEHGRYAFYVFVGDPA